jgi:hypothetical protein
MPDYQCCTFRGSVFSLNITGLYSVSVYGSQPAIDLKRNEVKIAVSNHGVVLGFVQTYVVQGYTNIALNTPFVTDYRVPGDFNEAVVHLDLDTGYITTSARLDSIDIMDHVEYQQVDHNNSF